MTRALGQHRRAAALVSLTVLAVLVVRSAPVKAEAGCFDDPQDFSSGLDIKTVCHDNDASAIAYTVETYKDFRDSDADFVWGVDTNGDQKYDLLVAVEFEGGRLVAKVEDGDENEKAHATVTRQAPKSLRVSYARTVVGGADAYNYNVKAVTDANGNGEADPGEVDIAPDSGFQQHRL